MKTVLTLAFSLIASAAMAQAQNQDLTCNNHVKAHAAQTAQNEVARLLVSSNVPAHHMTIANCDAFWAAKTIGHAYPKVMTVPECGVGIVFYNREDMVHGATALGGSKVMNPEGQIVRVCGTIVKY